MTWWDRFRCRMGWHNGDGEKWNDGFQWHSQCGRCQRPVLLDSQGNWFAIGESTEGGE